MLKNDISSTAITNKRLLPTANNSEDIASNETTPTKRKRKRKKSDPSFRKGMQLYGKKKSSDDDNKNVLAMRSDNSTELPTGEPVKHAAVISKSFFNNNPDLKNDENEITANFKKLAVKGKTNRSVTPTQFSATGTPIKVVTDTPSKTPLTLSLRYGPVVLFSNEQQRNSTPVVTELDPDSPFFKSEQYKAIKKALDKFKMNSVIVDKDLIKASAKERERNGGRVGSQNKTMINKGYTSKDGSATKYVLATGEFDSNSLWEHFHELAESLIGTTPLNIINTDYIARFDTKYGDENLACGNKHANTLMESVEQQYKYLASIYPAFMLTVKVDLIPDTQIATNITMTISTPKNITPHFEMSIHINAQTQQQPHIAISEYFKAFVVTLGEHAKTKIDTQDTTDRTKLVF